LSSTTLNAGVPTGPFVDPVSGEVTPAWRAFLVSIYRRTGGAIGQSSDTHALEVALATETTNRAAGDTALSARIDNEAAIRATADTVLTNNLASEAYFRSSTDNALSSGLGNEVAARTAADALLVPKAQLCTLWAACDLSFLPTSDPGGGKPWINDATLMVGTSSSTIAKMTLEDGSGVWTLEDPTPFDWIWG